MSKHFILITGGMGYIGLHLAQALLLKGRHVIASYRHDLTLAEQQVVAKLNDLAHERKVSFYTAYGSGEEVSTRLQHLSITTLVHLGGHKGVTDHSRDHEAVVENTTWVSNMLQYLHSDHDELRNVIFASSGSVYTSSIHPVTEHSLIGPLGAYARSKHHAETYFEDYCNRFELNGLTLRYFNVVGGCLKTQPDGIEAAIHRALKTGLPVEVFTQSHTLNPSGFVRDYICMDDLILGTVKALEYAEQQQSHRYDVLNIGTGVGTSTRDLIAMYEAKYQTQIHTVTRLVDPAFMPPSQTADISKARRVLDFNPTPIKEHLKL